MNLHTVEPSTIVIVGVTASGKSALALRLAQQFDGEIISADATAVYKGFTIGAAKPSQKDRILVPHYGLDVTEPTHSFNAAAFKQLAQGAVEEIAKRKKLPIIVGGSGLYIDSFLFDYDFRTPPDSLLRQQFNKYSLEELQNIAQRKQLDTNGLDIQNKRRLIRLIETEGQTVPKKDLRANTLVLGIDISKETLQTRIMQRTACMLEQGLEAEVKALSQKYDWSIEPMRAIGYREWRDYFSGKKQLDEVREEIIAHTMQLAKKQRTWFRRNKAIRWVNNYNEAVVYTTTFLNK